MKVTCPQCGRQGSLPDGMALPAKVRCPGCKSAFKPGVNSATGASPQKGSVKPPATTSNQADGLWYQDPFWRFVIGFPVLVLSCFAGYIKYQQSIVFQREQIANLVHEGERLKRGNQLRSAFDKFQSAILLGSDTNDKEAREFVQDAKTQSGYLQKVLKNQLEQEEAEQIQLLHLKEERERQEREIQLAEQRRSEAERKQATINSSIGGGAWTIKKTGQSEILRGLTVRILRAELLRRDLDSVSAALQMESDIDSFGFAAKDLVAQKISDMVNLNRLHSGIRYRSNDFGSSNNVKFSRIDDDIVWARVMKAALVEECETNIDGKYKTKALKGGKYLVHALHTTSFSLVEWLVPVEITDSGELTIDLFNKNADIIINKD